MSIQKKSNKNTHSELFITPQWFFNLLKVYNASNSIAKNIWKHLRIQLKEELEFHLSELMMKDEEDEPLMDYLIGAMDKPKSIDLSEFIAQNDKLGKSLEQTKQADQIVVKASIPVFMRWTGEYVANNQDFAVAVNGYLRFVAFYLKGDELNLDDESYGDFDSLLEVDEDEDLDLIGYDDIILKSPFSIEGAEFIRKVFDILNQGFQDQFQQTLPLPKSLPLPDLDALSEIQYGPLPHFPDIPQDLPITTLKTSYYNISYDIGVTAQEPFVWFWGAEIFVQWLNRKLYLFYLYGSPTDEETSYEFFRYNLDPSAFFTFGQVFKNLKNTPGVNYPLGKQVALVWAIDGFEAKNQYYALQLGRPDRIISNEIKNNLRHVSFVDPDTHEVIRHYSETTDPHFWHAQLSLTKKDVSRTFSHPAFQAYLEPARKLHKKKQKKQKHRRKQRNLQQKKRKKSKS